MIKNFIFPKEKLFKIIILSLLVIFVVSLLPLSDLQAQTQTPGGSVQLVSKDSTACKDVGSGRGTIKSFAYCISHLATRAFVPFIFSLALLSFMVAIFWYIRNADNEQKRGEAIKWIIWSVIGLFFMVTVWTFAKFFASDFFGSQGGVIPQFK